MFLDGPGAKARDSVRVIFAGRELPVVSDGDYADALGCHAVDEAIRISPGRAKAVTFITLRRCLRMRCQITDCLLDRLLKPLSRQRASC
jgi:hypothetical protein